MEWTGLLANSVISLAVGRVCSVCPLALPSKTPPSTPPLPCPHPACPTCPTLTLPLPLQANVPASTPPEEWPLDALVAKLRQYCYLMEDLTPEKLAAEARGDYEKMRGYLRWVAGLGWGGLGWAGQGMFGVKWWGG